MKSSLKRLPLPVLKNVVSDSNLETSASLITRTEVAPTSNTVEKASSEAVSTDTASTNVATQPIETTATQPSNEADKKVETAQSSETTIADRGAEVSSENKRQRNYFTGNTLTRWQVHIR